MTSNGLWRSEPIHEMSWLAQRLNQAILMVGLLVIWMFALFLQTRDIAWGVASCAVLGYIGVLFWARKQMRRRQYRRAIAAICVGLLPLSVVGVLVFPSSLATYGLLPVIAAIVAMPFLQLDAFRYLLVLCYVDMVGLVVLSDKVRLFSTLPPFPGLSHVVSMMAVALIIMVLLWYYHSSQVQMLHQTREMNMKLDQVRAVLEQQVQERTAELQALLRRYQAISEMTTDFVFAFRVDGPHSGLEWITDTFTKITGYQPHVLAGRGDWAKLVHPEDLAQVHLHGRAMMVGESFEHEFRIVCADGTQRWVRAYARPEYIDGGPQLRILGAARDTTERREFAEALALSEHKFETLLQSIQAIVWEADAAPLRCTFVSEQIEQVLGYTVEQCLDQPPFWIVHMHPDDQAATLAYSQRMTEQISDHAIEFRTRAAGGREVWLRNIITVEGDSAGPSRLRGVIVDITERKQLEAQYFQSQKMESIGRLAGGVAHDFNNLLTVITGSADLALQATGLDRNVRAELEEIHKTAGRASNLTRQLLTFASRQVLAPRPLALNDLIGDMQRLLRRLINAQIELNFELAGDLGQINADAGQIEQLIINMVLNARDAMPEGGRLTITTANLLLNGHTSQPTDIPDGNYVLLAINDTGIGMDATVKQRLFEPFFTTKGAGRGTGLGLATCYGVVKQHQGYIRVVSEPGCGATFNIYLPRTAATAATRPAHPVEAVTAGGHEMVLVAEDNPTVRALVARVLRGQGYTVLEVNDGSAALALLQRHAGPPFNLLVTDMVMPQVGGLALATQFAQAYPSACVLFISGYTETIIRRSDLPGTRSAFLHKPFTATTLSQAVRALLDGDSTPELLVV